MPVSREQFYKIANVKQHTEFEKYLSEIVFDRDKREEFYHKLLDIDNNLYYDTFKRYFEEYSAERKSNQQDYTPDSVSELLSMLTRSDPAKTDGWSAIDPTAGTGSLLIQKWKDDQLAESPWTYAPHNYFYLAQEFADNVIPYLLHNLAIRGMNCIVIHGDTLEKTAKQIYFVQNTDDDFLHFSSINVLPHNEMITKEFHISTWLEEPINHIEDQLDDVKYIPAFPMKRKPTEPNYNSKPVIPNFGSDPSLYRLKDIANVERAKSKKVYPAGTVVIQMSATRGQIGLLKSSGEVGSQYACVKFSELIPPYFGWQMLKLKAPRWFHRVQEGLNLKLQDIEQIPVTFTLAKRPIEYKQTLLNI